MDIARRNCHVEKTAAGDTELNNLLDITMTRRYAGICGVPVESLEEYFGKHIESLKTLREFKSVENMHDAILAQYGGYSWNGILIDELEELYSKLAR